MNIHAKINPDQEAIARFVARAAKVFGAPATITTRRLRTDRLACCYVCGLDDGALERVTYTGAPDGGVLVHRDCVWRFFRRLDAGALVPTGGDLPPVKQRPARERHLAEVMRQMKLHAFTPKDFFLTQAPPPVWIWQNAFARSRWNAREQKRRRIARLISFFGFTAHDLVPGNSELRTADTAQAVEGTQRADKESESKMDMSKYAGGNFLKVADLKEPFKAKIIDIEIGAKFDKPNLTFSEGSVLSLNATNCGTLLRAYGSDSDDWLGKEVEVHVGETDYKGEMIPTILLKPLSPSPESKKSIKKQPKKKDMDDEIPW
jgi:hypothetical protein